MFDIADKKFQIKERSFSNIVKGKTMGKIKIIAATLALFGAAQAFADSPIWGTQTVSCPVNSDTYIGIASTRAPVFAGKVQSVQSGTTNVVAVGEPNWAANQFVYSAGVQPNHYYLKFTSGELEGAWYDIKSNGAYYLQIEIGNAELAKIAAGDSFEVIPHWTMATLFPDGGGFVKSTKVAAPTGATILYKYTGYDSGVVYPAGTNKAALASFYYRERGSAVGWRDQDKADATDTVIEPNAFFKAVQPETEVSTVSVCGVVPMCATSFEVFTLTDGDNPQDQDIFVAAPSSVDMTLSELTASLVDTGIFTPSTSVVSAPVDTLFIYSNASTGKNLSADKTCYYRKRGAVNSWLDADKANADSAVIKAGTAIVIRKKAGAETVAYRCKFTPKYISK